MIRPIPRICISSTGGGGGKTLFSLGLGRAWRNEGRIVIPFKKGPDYIDPAWLSQACGNNATNLDPWFLDSGGLCDLFTQSMAPFPSATALLEGNRGLYDGLNETGDYSTAQVARVINCPILLCIDCSKSTRTVAAVVNGLANFEEGIAFAGVILNRVGSERHEKALRRAIEYNSSLPVLGALPRLDVNLLPERHMGIASLDGCPDEKVENVLEMLAQFVKHNCDTKAIFQCAEAAPPLSVNAIKGKKASRIEKRPRIGVIRDKAIWFYYQQNLDALEEAGGRLCELSLFEQSGNWNNLDGIYIGGGFPEDFCEKLANSPLLAKLAAYANMGMPIYAECGGLIILCRGLWHGEAFSPMANVFDATCQWLPKPQGLGYVNARIVGENPFYPIGLSMRGHEFHYSRINIETCSCVMELERGSGICKNAAGKVMDGLCKSNTWGSYMHVFAPALPCWAVNFVRLASDWRNYREKAFSLNTSR